MLNPSLRLLGRWFLPGGHAGRLSILMYHNVLARHDPLMPGVPDVAAFERDMNLLAGVFNVLSLDDAVERLRRGALPPRSVVITFDDGYAASVRNAVPVLKRFGFKATWYLVPGLFDGGRMWNDSAIEAIRRIPAGELDLGEFGLGRVSLDTLESRVDLIARVEAAFFGRAASEQGAIADYLKEQATSALPDDLMLTRDEVLALDADGMGIGSHTAHHAVLSQCDERTAEREMADGRDALNALLGRRVDHFAYPVGRPGRDFSAVHATIAERLGMSSAVTTGWGVSDRRTDPFQMPRFTPWDTSRIRYALRMFRNGVQRPTFVGSDQNPAQAL